MMNIENIVQDVLKKLSQKESKYDLFSVFINITEINLNEDKSIEEFIENNIHLQGG